MRALRAPDSFVALCGKNVMSSFHRSEFLKELKRLFPELRAQVNHQYGLLHLEMHEFEHFVNARIDVGDRRWNTFSSRSNTVQPTSYPCHPLRSGRRTGNHSETLHLSKSLWMGTSSVRLQTFMTHSEKHNKPLHPIAAKDAAPAERQRWNA